MQQISHTTNMPAPISVFNAFTKHCPDFNSECTWMSEDGVHPNADGDRAIAGLVYSTIAGSYRCNVGNKDKVDCGFSHITEAQCVQ